MIAIGCDHTALVLKQAICEFLDSRGIPYKDCGVHEVGCKEDYVDAAIATCAVINSGEAEKGILLCGTGIGISMAANKMKGIRAACCSDYFSAKYTRLHNDANVLCMGARVVGYGLATELVDVFLHTEFEGGRHAPRVERVMELQNQ